MRYYTLCLAVICCAATSSSSVHGSVLTEWVSADGDQNILEDSSLSNQDGTGALFAPNVGDVIYGWARISKIRNSDFSDVGYPADTLAVVFSAKVTSFDAVSKTYTLGYNDIDNTGDSDPTNDHRLVDLLPSFLGPKAGRAGTLGANEIAVIISNPNGFTDDKDKFKEGTLFDVANNPGTSYEATVGLVDPVQDFLEVNFDNPLGGFNELGGFTVMDASGSYGNGGGIIYIPVYGLTNFAGATKTPEVGLFGAILGGGFSGYDYTDKANFLINPIPEPASVAVWSLLAVGLVAVGRRRLSRKAA